METSVTQLPKGEDPYAILNFENGASLKVTLSFEGDFAPLVEWTDDDGAAKAAIMRNVFALVYTAFGGEAPVDAEGSDGETA